MTRQRQVKVTHETYVLPIPVRPGKPLRDLRWKPDAPSEPEQEDAG